MTVVVEDLEIHDADTGESGPCISELLVAGVPTSVLCPNPSVAVITTRCLGCGNTKRGGICGPCLDGLYAGDMVCVRCNGDLTEEL